MPVIDCQEVLKGVLVQEAMRRQVIRLPKQTPLEQAIRYTIKYKVNAILITDAAQAGLGVVSKTDLMGAYYAGLPLDTPCETVMMGPPLFCQATDTLDQAMDLMRTKRFHRLYVRENDSCKAVGVLAYPDIVGLLYRCCNKCEHSLRLRGCESKPLLDQLKTREVMTTEIYAQRENDSIQTVMEALAAYRFGALLIQAPDGSPAGVVSKTDLIVAYKHGLPASTRARVIMTSPVQGCDCNAPVVEALKTMIFSDVQRLFIYQGSPQSLVGVLSLSDVARFRSGTCRACLVSRIIS